MRVELETNVWLALDKDQGFIDSKLQGKGLIGSEQGSVVYWEWTRDEGLIGIAQGSRVYWWVKLETKGLIDSEQGPSSLLMSVLEKKGWLAVNKDQGFI